MAKQEIENIDSDKAFILFTKEMTSVNSLLQRMDEDEQSSVD